MNFESNLRIFLPVYFLLYFVLCVLWRIYAVWKQTKINPLMFGKTDDAYNYIGKIFKAGIACIGVNVLVFSIWRDWYPYLGPLDYLDHFSLKITGLVLLLISFPWVFFTQASMGASWRIGIDREHKTELLSSGFYRFSRNPIYLGLLATLAGLFLITPNALTFMILILGITLVQIQVRLEENHLERTHGDAYLKFLKSVPRWI
jgi:protein-S-isoprenylcysteine O-methyltransferase Ste14